MTAYGRASRVSPFGTWVVEIHSVNRKVLDINIALPKELLRFDVEIRKWLAEYLVRGQVTVKVQWEAGKEALFSSLSQLKELKSKWEEIALGLGFQPKESINLKFLVEQMKTCSKDDFADEESRIREDLKIVLEEAVQELHQMKLREGKSLLTDLEKRLSIIEECKEEISIFSPAAPSRYRQKLQERIQEVCALGPESDERVLREVVIYAEKIDIAEELTRLHSHLEQFRALLKAEERTVGKTLDFLAQEMNREINTIASKSDDVAVIHLTVTMKSELERIREQIQNVE